MSSKAHQRTPAKLETHQPSILFPQAKTASVNVDALLSASHSALQASRAIATATFQGKPGTTANRNLHNIANLTSSLAGLSQALGQIGQDLKVDLLTSHKTASMCDAIEDEILRLCWVASEIRARTANEVRVKAQVLSHIVGGEPDDVASQLAKSLCQDLLSRDVKCDPA